MKNLPKNGVGVELGVFKGEFSKKLISETQPKQLYLVDLWWTEFGEYFPNWGSYTDFGKLKTRDAYNMVTKLKDAHTKMHIIIHVGDDLAFLRNLDDNSLDWAYIDSSHMYEHTLQELLLLDKKMNPQGVIAGHDWQPHPHHRHHGVYKAVLKFCERTQWELKMKDIHTQWALVRKT